MKGEDAYDCLEIVAVEDGCVERWTGETVSAAINQYDRWMYYVIHDDLLFGIESYCNVVAGTKWNTESRV